MINANSKAAADASNEITEGKINEDVQQLKKIFPRQERVEGSLSAGTITQPFPEPDEISREEIEEDYPTVEPSEKKESPRQMNRRTSRRAIRMRQSSNVEA